MLGGMSIRLTWADDLIALWERSCRNYARERGEGLLER
jgi:hypothetical protein